MIRTLAGLLDRFLRQDVARANAAQASVRLGRRRRQVEDTDAFLAERLAARVNTGPAPASDPVTNQAAGRYRSR